MLSVAQKNFYQMISYRLFLEEFLSIDQVLQFFYIHYFSYLLSVRLDPMFIALFLQHILCSYFYLICFFDQLALSNLQYLTCFIFVRQRMNVGSIKCAYMYVCMYVRFREIYFCSIQRWGRDSSVSTVTRYRLDGPEIESQQGRDFPHLSRPALGPNQPPIQWVLGLYRG